MRVRVGTSGAIGATMGRSDYSAAEALKLADKYRADAALNVRFTDAGTGQEVSEADVIRAAKKERAGATRS